MKFKVGDKARVKDNLKVGSVYGNLGFNDSMAELRGRTVTINDVAGNKYYRIDELHFLWTDEMLEEVDVTKYKLVTKGLTHLRNLYKKERGCDEYALLRWPSEGEGYRSEFTREEILNLPEEWMKQLEWVPVKEPKYHLKAGGCISGYEFLNYHINDGVYELNSLFEIEGMQTEFTQKEIDNLPEEWMRCLEQVPVEG